MNNSPWPMVPLNTLLRRERRPVEVKPNEEYAEIGVYCFGKGIFHKSPRTGFEVGDKKLFRIEEGDFILQITFAWEGAVALASKSESGMFGSTRFPTFRVDEDQCYPPFLLNYFKTESGRFQLVKISPGSAGRNRVLSLKRFPEVLVPLPPLTEQRRIVARIERLAAKVDAARTLREQATAEVENVVAAALDSVTAFTSSRRKPLHSVAKEVSAKTTGIESSNEVYLSLADVEANSGRILQRQTAAESKIQGTASRFEQGMVLYGKLRPYLNKVIVASFNGICTTEFVVLLPDADQIIPQFFAWYLRSPTVVSKLVENSSGTKMPRTNLKVFRNLQIPLPTLPEQRRIVAHLDALQAKLTLVQQHQTATQARLDALLPSILDKAFRGEL